MAESRTTTPSPAGGHALERLRELNAFIQDCRTGQLLSPEEVARQDEIHRRIGDIIGILKGG